MRRVAAQLDGNARPHRLTRQRAEPETHEVHWAVSNLKRDTGNDIQSQL